MIGDFHFLRPWAFFALVPAALLFWLIYRRQSVSRAWRGIVAPHLLPYLLSGENRRRRLGPLTWLGVGWSIGIIALAGPTWRREPAPFADDTASLAIILRVGPSMKTEDVPPSRLARAVEKIRDLLAQRPGAKTALVAYEGSAHVVVPVTTDSGIINSFAAALDPKIMPSDGDVPADALRLADQALAGAGSGSILWITDSIVPEQRAELAGWRKGSRTPVRLLVPLYGGPELDQVRDVAKSVDATFVRLTTDNADIDALARAAKFSTVATGESGGPWEESGYWLMPLLAILMLPFARRGWMVSTAAKS
jgi:Ca-activated chloride channel family protein